MRDLIKRISKAEEMIEQKQNQNSIDCTIYGVLNDCKSELKSQQDRLEKMSSLLGEAYKELERLQPKNGKWIEYAGDQKCSVCGSSYSDLHPEYSRTPFCPHCGAKMEGGDGE